MTAWETAVCQRAVEAFGKEHQLIICMEEMAELTKELTKHLRGRDNLPQIAKEMADVEIMLEQLKLLFDLRGAVADAKEAKLIRLQEMSAKREKEVAEIKAIMANWIEADIKRCDALHFTIPMTETPE